MGDNCDGCGKPFGLVGVSKKMPNGSLFCSDCYKKTLPKPKVKEIKCTCKECGKVWHYLLQEESPNQIEKTNACATCATCGSPFGMYFANKTAEARGKRESLQQCPECNSRNVKKEVIEYEKPTN